MTTCRRRSGVPPRPTEYIPIGGTRAWNDRGAPKRRWWQRDSEFCKMMAGLNCIMVDPDQPFVWTTDLNGVQFWKRWKIWGKTTDTFSDHRDWVCGGENFLRYCDSVRGPIPYEARNIITHSHGFQVWAYASAMGLRTRKLVSIAPPYRHDMEGTIRLARPNVEYWVLIIDPSADSVADLGAFGDGIIRHDRTFRADGCRPDLTIRIPAIGHSGVLGDGTTLWNEGGLAEYLR